MGMPSREATRAVGKVTNALKKGTLVRGTTCEVCGVTSGELVERKDKELADAIEKFRLYGWTVYAQGSSHSACMMVAHHWNGYDNPLDVWWICRSCNRKLQHKHDGSLTLELAKFYVKNFAPVPLAFAPTHEEILEAFHWGRHSMAVAGGACSAYRVWLDDVRLCMCQTTTMRDLCDKPDAAIRLIKDGKVATVAGSDVDQVRMAVSREVVK